MIILTEVLCPDRLCFLICFRLMVIFFISTFDFELVPQGLQPCFFFVMVLLDLVVIFRR